MRIAHFCLFWGAFFFASVYIHTEAAPAGEVSIQFSYADATAKAVFLAGEFNQWNTTATPMQQGSDGTWTVEVPLVPGKYQYKFVVDGKWQQDPSNPDEAPDGHGGKNSVATVADLGADSVVSDKDEIQAAAANLFSQDDFKSLEKLANQLRETKARFSDGLWKLPEFYRGLGPQHTTEYSSDWKPWFDKLDAWHAQFPQSITQPVVLAQGLSDYAWKARGAGMGYTISKEGRRLFDDRLRQARAVLEAAASLPSKCPEWAIEMQVVALGQGWSRENYLQLLKEAVSKEPTYYDYYGRAAIFFLPRWYGRSGDWEEIAEEAASSFDSQEGMSAYARTAWFTAGYYDNLFKQTKITWPKLRQGFLDIQRAYPNSRWNLNAFCRFAVMARDRITANELFKRIGDHGDPNWTGYRNYELAREWADPSTPQWRVFPLLGLHSLHTSPRAIHSVAFSPDGSLVAAGDAGGQIIMWEARGGSEKWHENAANFPVMSVAFSPDGKLFAAGIGEEHETTRPGVVKFWSTDTMTQVDEVKPKSGAVWSIAFSQDSKLLAIAGGQYNKQAEAYIYDIQARELRPMSWTSGHDHGLHSIALSPDSKVVAADCYQSITIANGTDGNAVFQARNTLPTFTQAVAFSPNGKTLVVAGTPQWQHHNNQPGGLTLWDTSDWKQITPRQQQEAGGLFSVAVSSDGSSIAGAGHDQAVHVWDASTLKEKASFIELDGLIWAVAFSPDGGTVAAGNDDGTVKVWALPN